MTGAGLELRDDDAAPLVARGDAVTSRSEIKRLADELITRIKDADISRVMVRSDDPVHILRAIDACNRAGADLFIAHTNLPDDLIEEMCDEFEVGLLVGDKDRLRPSAAPVEPPSGRIHMMTSGTTGRPKVARHELESLLARVRGPAQLPANRDGRWLLVYQPTGFAGVQVQLTAAMSHGVVVAPTERTPSGFYEAAVKGEVTQVSATPTFWRAFLMIAKPHELKLKQITLGGEAADQATLDRLRAAFPDTRITHIYASTEAGVVFAVHDCQEGFPAAWLDIPRAGAQLRIREGFLQIKTPNVMRGYVSQTDQPLSNDGWLTTADLCEVVGDRAYIRGRDDATINVGGSKVYPLAVETVLLSDPGVREARVFGQPNPVTGFLVAADVVLADGEDPQEARPRILSACREQLADYQVPRIMKFVDAIAVGESGKKG